MGDTGGPRAQEHCPQPEGRSGAGTFLGTGAAAGTREFITLHSHGWQKPVPHQGNVRRWKISCEFINLFLCLWLSSEEPRAVLGSQAAGFWNVLNVSFRRENKDSSFLLFPQKIQP